MITTDTMINRRRRSDQKSSQKIGKKTRSQLNFKKDVINSRVLDRIVGGETAQPHSFPWMVSLRDPAAPKGEEKNDCK